MTNKLHHQNEAVAGYFSVSDSDLFAAIRRKQVRIGAIKRTVYRSKAGSNCCPVDSRW